MSVVPKAKDAGALLEMPKTDSASGDAASGAQPAAANNAWALPDRGPLEKVRPFVWRNHSREQTHTHTHTPEKRTSSVLKRVLRTRKRVERAHAHEQQTHTPKTKRRARSSTRWRA